MKIVIAGTRGIPARYGGFETFADELSKRLVERGHRVLVFGRRSFFSKNSKLGSLGGVLLDSAPTIFHKYLETPLASLFTFINVITRKLKGDPYDLILLCNAANSPFAWLPRLFGIPVIINVDGIERKRSKWNWLGKLWYRLGELSSVLFGSRVVGDADVIVEYYKKNFKCNAVMIPYGASAIRKEPGATLDRFGLKPKGYILYVSRLEPENNAYGVVEAYNGLSTRLQLVIVGDAPYAKEYIERVKGIASPGVIFTGYQFGEAYQELQSNCYLYIQATEVGGTHPALIEAMAYGNCVVANGTSENREVLGDAGLIYEANDFTHLRALLSDLIENPIRALELGERAKQRANQRYEWEAVTSQYESLFFEVLGVQETDIAIRQHDKVQGA